MNIAIALDNWKLPVFREHLTKAGYEYQDGGALIGDTTLLTIETDDMLALKRVIEECQAVCRKRRKPNQ